MLSAVWQTYHNSAVTTYIKLIVSVANMKKLLAIIILTFMPLLLSAQKNMAINSLFNGQLGKSNVSETIIKGPKIEEYGLDTYHSLSTKQPEHATRIEAAVLRDAKAATTKETQYVGNKLYYAFITFHNHYYNTYKYIFYLNNTLKGGKDIILIYMDGDANVDQVKKMLKR